MKMVILRTNTADFGKIGTYNVQEVGLASAMKKKGHEVNVLYLNRNVNNITKDETYDFVYYLPHKTFGLHGIFNVNILSKFEADMLILFSDNQLWAKNVILWCRDNNVKCVQYLGNVLSDNPNWLHQFYTKLILRRNLKSYHYSINVAKTEKVRIEMEHLNVPFEKIIHVGLDDSVLNESVNPDYTMREKMGYSNDQFILLFVGRLIDYKRPFLACDILEAFIKKGLNAKMIIIGKGELEKELLTYIHEHEMDDVIMLKGRVPYEEMYKYMVTSNCFINLSEKEIFGMTILEAMYYKLPVVAHTAPGPNEVIINKETGYLCDTYDINTWCELILRASADKDLGEKSRKYVKEHFLWDLIADDFIAL